MTGTLSRRRLLALVGAGVGTLAGCGYRPGGGDVRWEVGVGTGPYRPDDVLAAGGTLFAVNRSVRGFDFETEEWGESADIEAYDAASGEKRWEERTPPCGRAATGDRTLYLGHEDAGLVAFDVDGQARWETAVESFPRVVAAADGRVYALTDAGELAAFDAGDGEQLWSDSVGEESDSIDTATDADLAATDEGVYVRRASDAGSGGTAITAVRPDGERRWEARVAAGGTGGRASLVDGDAALYVPGDGSLFALALRDGTERWSTQAGDGRRAGAESVAVADGTAYHVRGRTLYARDAADGSERWRFQPSDRRGVTSPPAVADGTVYVGASDALYALAGSDGSVRWRVESDDVRSAPLIVGRTVAVATGDGVVRGHWRE